MNKRVWELDAFRGLCVLGMVIVHFVYDLTGLYGILHWQVPDWFLFVQNWGGVLFLLISGICVTLGSRSVRRGLIVFACGLIVSAATWGMYRFWDFHRSIIIYFGVLHCLGICMLLWPPFKKCPAWFLAVAGLAVTGAGFWANAQTVESPWLFPLGLTTGSFASSDYFPLLPYFGFFLLGAALGKSVYRKKQTLFPKINAQNPILGFFQLCGRHSLWIYLLHQPVLAGICMLLA